MRHYVVVVNNAVLLWTCQKPRGSLPVFAWLQIIQVITVLLLWFVLHHYYLIELSSNLIDMSLSTAANENCSYIEEQLNRDALNPFAVFGLRADDVLLTHNGARLRFKVLVKHVFESGDLGATTGDPRVLYGDIFMWRRIGCSKMG